MQFHLAKCRCQVMKKTLDEAIRAVCGNPYQLSELRKLAILTPISPKPITTITTTSSPETHHSVSHQPQVHKQWLIKRYSTLWRWCQDTVSWVLPLPKGSAVKSWTSMSWAKPAQPGVMYPLSAIKYMIARSLKVEVCKLRCHFFKSYLELAT